MRQNKTTKTKDESIKSAFYGKKAILAVLILGSFLICLTTAPVSFMQSTVKDSPAKAQPTPPNDVLDE